MPEVAKQPPGACGGERGGGVVDDRGPGGADAGASHRGLERGRVRERMASSGPGWGGQVGVEVDVDGARDMATLVFLTPGRPAELPADVEQGRRGVRVGSIGYQLPEFCR
jgi:hypothetical protein